MILQFTRILKTSFQHMIRNAKLSLASILVMSLTFFVSTIFLVALYSAGVILNYFETQSSQLIVFFSPDTADQAYIDGVKKNIQKISPDLDIYYVNKKEAYNRFLKFLNQDTPSLSESIDPNKIPTSYEIKAKNIHDIDKVYTYVLSEKEKNNGKIHNIIYFKNIEDFLNEFIKIVKYVGIGLITFLSSISLLIIWITIGIALSSHSDEIEIMQLVGATRKYIDLPYIIEGAVYGILGSLASLVIITLIYFGLTIFKPSFYTSFIGFFNGIPFPSITLQQIAISVIMEMVAGALIGSIGSYIALRRKIK